MTQRREEHGKVILLEKDLQVDEEGVLSHPITNDCNTAQLVRRGGWTHDLVARNNTPCGPDRELSTTDLTNMELPQQPNTKKDLSVQSETLLYLGSNTTKAHRPKTTYIPASLFTL